MNQAGSENKCSKTVSNECILNNYNFDDVSIDQNSICENCKQRGWSVCGKHSSHVGIVSNTEHVVEVAEVSQQKQQTDINNACHQSLLQKAWVYLQSVITTHMSGCPRCHSKPPPSPSVESPSQSSIVSFLSSTSSPSLSPSPSRLSCQQSCLSCMTSCHRGRSPSQDRPSCPRASSSCRNARPSCPRAFSPCPRPTPPCPNIKPPSPKAKQTYPKPNAKQSSANAKRSYPKHNAKPTSSDAKPTCPHDKPTSPDAKLTYPHAKPSGLNAKCPNHKCPNAIPSLPNLQPPYPSAIPPCLNAQCPSADQSYPSLQPPCPNAKCPNAKPSCPCLQPLCPHAKPPSPNAIPPCPYAKPPSPNVKCPNIKPSCPSLQPPCPKAKPSNTNFQPSSPCAEPCPNSKTSLYHSFSNDSLSSICKKALVELAKVYLQKMTSDHKIRCPRCSKRPTCANSKETVTSYLRSVLDQAWSYFNMSTKQNTCQPQRTLSNCLHISTSPRISESPTPTKSRCCCAGSQPKSPKTQSCESVCCPKPVSSSKSVTIPEPVTCPRPVSCPTCHKHAACAKPAACPKFYKCQGTTSPAQRSEEEGTHEHKSCYTPCCMHNSQGVQPSHIMSDKSCWSLEANVNPLYIRSRQIKTPQSVEELKASITGSDKSSGNMLGCEIMDFRSIIKYSKPCVQDLKESKDSICSTDTRTGPPKLGYSVTMEQKDHKIGSRPKECKHSKESLDHCEDTMSHCNNLEEQTCKEEAPCPSSGGNAKSDEAPLDTDFGNKPREQVHSKEKIWKSGRNSLTCVDSNHPDRKDCNAPEKDGHRKDPYNYRYYY